MIVALIALSILLFIVTMYLLYYKSQIKEVGNQLAFISKHHSFKFIHTQIKPKEVAHLIELCNTLLRSQRELHHRFIKKNEEINATIVSLSHDIRTPLTSVDGYLQLAERTKDSHEKQQYIIQAQSRVERINRLVDELFLYTKLENKEYSFDLERLNMVNVLQKRLFTFMDDFSQRGSEPDVRVPERPVYIIGNSSALERIFENIIRNYFVHGEGTLQIRYEEREHTHIVQFINGMRAGKSLDLNHIFTRFYKEDPSRTSQSSGLGLYIVQSLMEKMNGDVFVDVEDDQFCLSIVFTKTDGERDYGGECHAANDINH